MFAKKPTPLLREDAAVRRGGAQQLFVCAHGIHGAVTQDDDQVCPPDLRKAMRDDEGGASFGGSEDDAGYDILLDEGENVIITGYTESSDYPHTMTAVYDSGTGGVDMFLRRDRLPWVAFNQKGSIGVSYGVKNSTTGSVSRLYGRFDLIQIKRLHAGILGDVDTDGDKYGGAFAEYRW